MPKITDQGGWSTMQHVYKRLVDILVSVAVALLLGPMAAVVALLVAILLGSPVIFKQLRPGLHGRPFMLYKFRTMVDARDDNGNLLPDEKRMTRFGRVLRSTSVDEIPEIFNVLIGDMSLVGPRPLLMEYLDRYTSHQARRHEVRPGITGWAQINGRNTLSWEEKFDLDVWYVDHWSLWLDIRILSLTVSKVLRRDGISTEGHSTAPLFMGSRDRGAKI